MRKTIPFLVLLTACNKQPIKTTPETEARIKAAPDWYLDRKTSNTYLYGHAQAESQDMNFAIEMAESMARADAGRQIEIKYGELQKRFQEQTRLTDGSDMLQQFSSAFKQVTSENLVGVRTDKLVVIPGNKVYIVFARAELPIGEANKRFIENLRNRQSLYTRFRATEMYEELSRETQALDSVRLIQPLLPMPTVPRLP